MRWNKAVWVTLAVVAGLGSVWAAPPAVRWTSPDGPPAPLDFWKQIGHALPIPADANGSDRQLVHQAAGEVNPVSGTAGAEIQAEAVEPAHLAASAVAAQAQLAEFARAKPTGGDGWLDEYRQRIMDLPERSGQRQEAGRISQLPADFQPWWQTAVAQPQQVRAQPLGVNVESLVYGALAHSPHVDAIQGIAPIEELRVCEADAVFDWMAFIRTTWDDTSDPVGNVLTTGGSPRFRDHLWGGTAGVRKLTRHGGEVEISQRLGFQDNNSRFFVPSQQGNAQFSISFTQPLLNSAGEFYNTSRTVQAQINSEIAQDELSRQLQDHLLKVARGYWDLYQARAVRLQKQRQYARGESILETLDARREFDSVQTQVVRAEAAVASRYAEILRADLQARNAETSLRTLVNDPQLLAGDGVELLPQERPLNVYAPQSLRGSLLTALENRPEIAQAVQNVRSASLQLGVAEQQLLPVLDLVMGMYVAGLEGHSEIGTAFANQFSQGEPGYSLGLIFEVPLGNRRARAIQARREWEMRRAIDQMRATVGTTLAEVEMAVREAETSYRELLAKYHAMQAAETEVNYYHQHWLLATGSRRAPSFVLEDLLDAQDRLAREEQGFVAAQVNYTFAQINVKRATGTLLQAVQTHAAERTPKPVEPATQAAEESPAKERR